MTTHHQDRDTHGRYQHRLDRLCRCGHTRGQHTAERVHCHGRIRSGQEKRYGVCTRCGTVDFKQEREK